MTKLYVHAHVWLTELAEELRREEGAEAIEYLGMAVVIAVLAVAVISVMNAQKQSIADSIVGFITSAIAALTGMF